MTMTVALVLLGLTVALACWPASADELRVNEHRLVIEGPFGGTRGYVRATPSGRLIIENRSGRRVGSVRALPDGERATVECRRGRGCLELLD